MLLVVGMLAKMSTLWRYLRVFPIKTHQEASHMGDVLRKMIFNPSTTAPIATNDVLLPNGPGFGHCHQCCQYN